MNNLNESVKYTKKKKHQQVTKFEEPYLKQSIQSLESYINNSGKDILIGIYLNRISTWYLWKYLDNFLQEKKVNYNYITQSAIYGIESIVWDFNIYKIYKKNHIVSLEEASLSLCKMLFLNWKEEAIEFGNLILKNSTSIELNKPYYIEFVFRLFAKWQNKEYIKKLTFPNEVKIYEDILNDWDTKDNYKFELLMNDFCQFHIHQSNEYENKNSPEISRADFFIFPLEILFWQKIRQFENLSYLSNNELLNFDINISPQEHIPYSDDILIQKIKQKLLSNHPNILD